MENNIIWDDIVEECDKAQRQARSSDDLKQAREIRDDGLRKAIVKLDY